MDKPRRRSFSWSSLVFLAIGVLLGGLVVAVIAPWRSSAALTTTPTPPAPPTAAPTGAPTAAPTAVPVDVAHTRPYTESSPWNTQIGPAPRYDTHSDEMIATIGLKGDGRITSNPSTYSKTVYFADAAAPRFDVPCTKYRCTVTAQDGTTTKTDLLKDVPIPSGANPASGTDAAMIIVDTTTFAEYDFWGAERTDTGWTSRSTSVYNIRWDGAPEVYGARGGGVPSYAGLIRQWEIVQGHIDHAISFSYPYPAQDRCVFPASKTDGNSALPYAIPEGARIQLDPTLTEADFDRMGLDQTGKIIARALQKYGMILTDFGGVPKILAENLADNPTAAAQWSDAEFNLTGNTIAKLPYTSFHVIALPDSYWSPAPNSSTHGKCYAYPDSSRSAAGG